MYYNISHKPKNKYIINTPGEHIFYFENISADINFIIDAENADVSIYGLYIGNDSEQFILNITQTHASPNSHSTALIKSVLNDTSQLHFTGKIRIEKIAQNSQALLTNKNLLLSDTAHVVSIPQLEVFPHQVECTHAATTAPLDQEQLHYIISRGISKKDAQKLLINGFTQEILQYKNE